MRASTAPKRSRVCLFWLGALGTALITSTAIPAFASPNRASVPIGTVLEMKVSQVNQELNSGGETIYDGDRLETSAATELRAELRGMEVYLLPETVTEVHGNRDGVSAALLRGTVVVSSREGQTFELHANGATIFPANPLQTVAQVTWVSPRELILSCERGAIKASFDGIAELIEAGNSYRMRIETEGSAPQDNGGHGQQGTHPVGRSHVYWILIPAVAVATGVGLWRALMSPSAP